MTVILLMTLRERWTSWASRALASDEHNQSFCGDLSIRQAGSGNRSDEKPNPDSFPSSTRVNYIICYEDNLTIYTLHLKQLLWAVFLSFAVLMAQGLSIELCISRTMNRLGAMATR